MGAGQRLRQRPGVVVEVMVEEIGHRVRGVAEDLSQPEGDELLCNGHDANSTESRKMEGWAARW